MPPCFPCREEVVDDIVEVADDIVEVAEEGKGPLQRGTQREGKGT